MDVLSASEFAKEILSRIGISDAQQQSGQVLLVTLALLAWRRAWLEVPDERRESA